MNTIIVERRDTGRVLARVQLSTGVPRGLEPVRAARFAAWHLGATCWARADTGGRVLYVGRPAAALDPVVWKERAACAFPGCPTLVWRHESYLVGPWGGERCEVPQMDWLAEHQAQAHVLCTCGRFFTEEGWRKHRSQVMRTDRRASRHLGGAPLHIKLRPGVGVLHGTRGR